MSFIQQLQAVIRARKTIERYCMFLGYPRSGHTLVRSILDAHEEVVIANEENVLEHMPRGIFKRERLFLTLLQNAECMAKRGNEWTNYSYAIPDTHQGSCATLRVIGDKKGGASTEILKKHPERFRELGTIVRVPIYTIHCVRNPYDNITTMAQRSNRSIAEVIKEYRGKVQFMEAWENTHAQNDTHLRVYYEKLCKDPEATIQTLFDFLDITASPSFIHTVSNIVQHSKHSTDKKTPWTPAQRAQVRDLITQTPFLSPYAE